LNGALPDPAGRTSGITPPGTPPAGGPDFTPRLGKQLSSVPAMGALLHPASAASNTPQEMTRFMAV